MTTSSPTLSGIPSATALIDSLDLPVFGGLVLAGTSGVPSLTATVTLSSAAEGTLDVAEVTAQAAALGVSLSMSNGVVTLNGSAVSLQAALRLVRFQPAEGKAGVEVTGGVMVTVSNEAAATSFTETLNVAGTGQAPTTPDAGTNTSVFIGAAADMQTLEPSSVTAPMLADGDIGLYGHTNGIFSMVVAGQMQALVSDWKGSAPGVAELGGDQGLANGQVTVTNKTNGTLVIPVGQNFVGSNGLSYVLTAAPGQPGIDAPGQMASNGYVSGGSSLAATTYHIAAGQTVTLDLEAGSFGNAYNLAANGIVSSGIAGLSVVSSSSIAGGGNWTNPANAGSGTTANPEFLSGAPGQIEGLEHAQGYLATEANVNEGPDDAWTANDLAAWTGYVASARAEGILNVAPIWSANGLDVDYSQPFATSGYFANVRQAALVGGGLAFDTPPWFFSNFTPAWFPVFGHNASDYQSFIEQQIRWANSEGLRSSIIISPDSSDGGHSSSPVWDNNLLANTETMVAELKAAGAMPSQFIIENYTGTDQSNMASPTDPNSLNAVALYLSTVATVSTTSESGLEVAGAAPVDMEMNGIVSSFSLGSFGTGSPYSQAVVGTTRTAGQMTLTVTLDAGGTLSDSIGGLSANGRVLTVTGTAATIQQALDGLQVTDTAPVATTTRLSVALTDASGTAQGSTTVSLAPSDLNFAVSGDSVVVNGPAGGVAAVDASALGMAFPTVFGGASTLHLTGGNTEVVLNGAAATGSADVSSTGGDQVWAGNEGQPLAFHATGGGNVLLGSEANGAITNITVTNSMAAGATEVSLMGQPGGVTYLFSDGSAPVTVLAGNDQLDFTGSNATIRMNDGGTGCAYITSTGGLTLWGPDVNFANFNESGAGSDTLIAGNGGLFVFGTATQNPTGITTITGEANSAGTLRYTGGTKALSADLSRTAGNDSFSLGSGAATIRSGSGSTVITGGSGTLLAELNAAGTAALSIDGNSSGMVDIQGFHSGADTLSVSGVESVAVAGGNTIITLVDGHAVTVEGDTDPSRAGIALSGPGASASASPAETVFVGGAYGMPNLLPASVNAPLVAAGVGLYMHGVGADELVSDGTMSQMVKDFASGSPGVAELGYGFGLAGGSITVENNGTGALTIPVGSLFATADGHQYAVVAAPGQPGVIAPGQVSTDGYVSGGTAGFGSYQLNAGSSLTLRVEASGYGTGYNQSANAITSSSLAGLTVASSTAMTGADYWTNPAQSGLVASTAGSESFWYPDSTYTYGTVSGLFFNYGFRPTEANVNMDDNYGWTAGDLAAWKGFVDNGRANGVLSIAPIISFNGQNADYSQPFATNGFFANIRAAALYGGGLALDVPPQNFEADSEAFWSIKGGPADTYVDYIEQTIRWANAEGIRSSVILSPDTGWTGGSEDTNLATNTTAMLAQLRAAGAMPSQIIVEDYSSADTGNWASASDPNSVNLLALQVAGATKLSSSVAEQGLESAGTKPVDFILSGVAGFVDDTSGTARAPWSGLVVGAAPSATSISASVTLSGSGTLEDSAGGLVATDGRSWTFSGAPAALQAALDSLTVVGTASATATASLALRVSDASGTVMSSSVVAVGASDTPDGSLSGAILSGGNVLVGNGASAAVDTTTTGQTNPIVFGGAASLALHALDTTVVLNAAAASGQVSLASGGGNTVWLGAATVTDTPGGSAPDLFLAGTTPGIGSNLNLSGGSSTSQTEVSLEGAGGSTDYVTTDGQAPITVFGGNDQLDFTGANATLVLNGNGTGPAYLSSLGGVTLWSGDHSFTDFTESAVGNDTVVAGKGPLFIFGTGAANPTGTTEVLGTAGGGSVSYQGGAKSLDMDLSQDSGAATVTLASGAASIHAGTGNTTVTAGTGSLTLDLSHAVKALLQVDGSTAGNASVFGFQSGADSIAVHAVASSTVSGGNLVLSLADGHSLTVFGDTDPNHAGISFT